MTKAGDAIKPGDVVFGKFACENGRVLRHFAVVLQVSGDALMLVYTTSLKDEVKESHPITHFTLEDLEGYQQKTPARWDARVISIVPRRTVYPVGRITERTFGIIEAAFMRAQKAKTLSVAMLNEQGQVQTA